MAKRLKWDYKYVVKNPDGKTSGFGVSKNHRTEADARAAFAAHARRVARSGAKLEGVLLIPGSDETFTLS